MIKPFRRALPCLLCLALLAAGVCLLFWDRHATLASVSRLGCGDLLVIGESSDRVNGWEITFCWRRHNGPWARYYLDHESGLWRDVDICVETNEILIVQAGEVRGRLASDGTFLNSRHKQVSHSPALIIADADPFNRAHAVYPENAAWTSFWPLAGALPR